MGTTVTTNLGLIKPDLDEKIREDLPTFPGWADQNADNCDVIDNLYRHTEHSWTPTWTTDIASNPVLGSGGSLEGKYLRLYPRMVIGFFRINAGGAGFSAGSGLYRLSVPVNISSEFSAFGAHSVGKAYLDDNDAVATSTNMVVLYDPTINLFTFRRHDGDFWRSTSPITLAQNDKVSGFFVYPTAVA